MKQLTVSELVGILQGMPKGAPVYIDDSLESVPSARTMSVTNTHSYRGYYEQVAFEPCFKTSTIREVVDMLTTIRGSTIRGYKGGKFFIHDATPVWVSHPGVVSNRMIIGVIMNNDGAVTLKTDIEMI